MISGYYGAISLTLRIIYFSWHDGKHWNVVIDTTEEGDLGRDGVPKLRPYSETFEYAKLTNQDKLNVSVNIYEKVRCRRY